MADKKKPRTAGIGTASKTTFDNQNNTVHTRIKAAIVRLALWGFLTLKMAEWLIQREGLRRV